MTRSDGQTTFCTDWDSKQIYTSRPYLHNPDKEKSTPSAIGDYLVSVGDEEIPNYSLPPKFYDAVGYRFGIFLLL